MAAIIVPTSTVVVDLFPFSFFSICLLDHYKIKSVKVFMVTEKTLKSILSRLFIDFT